LTETHYIENEARGARTQSLFRDVNERVMTINQAFSIAIAHADWICECADPACSERISLTMEEYEAVRASPIRFAVAPGAEHFFEELEVVVDKNERFWVVEKTGTAGELAAQIDPRRVGLRGESLPSPLEKEVSGKTA
jgi:streptogramin lyase